MPAEGFGDPPLVNKVGVCVVSQLPITTLESESRRGEPSTLFSFAIASALVCTGPLVAVGDSCDRYAAATRAAASAPRRISVLAVCTRPRSTANEQKPNIATRLTMM